jgi:hypothetical protein
MNTIRNALARPGASSGSVMVLNSRGRCTQCLRSLFEAGADRLDDADEHEIGDGRQGERLREPHTGSP